MFFSKLVIKDKEPCPCGSDKKYKDCCKGKSPKIEIKSKKPPDVQVMEKMRLAMKKYCLHPDKDKCKGKIKAAHALQNNKIISLLAGNKRHVYMLDTKKKPLLISINKLLFMKSLHIHGESKTLVCWNGQNAVWCFQTLIPHTLKLGNSLFPYWI